MHFKEIRYRKTQQKRFKLNTEKLVPQIKGPRRGEPLKKIVRHLLSVTPGFT